MSQNTDAAAQQRYYIATPADPRAFGIFGLGRTPEAAVAAAHEAGGTHAATVTEDLEGRWLVADGVHEDRTFDIEEDAQIYAERLGFTAEECTERMYRYIETDGTPRSWVETEAGLQDLEDRDA